MACALLKKMTISSERYVKQELFKSHSKRWNYDFKRSKINYKAIYEIPIELLLIGSI